MSDTASGAVDRPAAIPAGITGGASIARVLAGLATCAATLIVVAAILPGSGITQPLFVIAPAGGYVFSALLWWQGRRLPRWCVEVVLGIGIGLVTIAMHFGGPLAEPMALFYVWISIYAFCYLPLRNAAAQTVLIAVGCGVASTELRAGLSFWLLVVGSSVTAGYWVHRLVAHIRALAEVEVARARAESASKAKTEFLSRMSHELRTPLTAILGYAELLEQEQLTADDDHSVASILRAGTHLLNLINEILDISRIEEGVGVFSIEPVTVAALIADANEMIGPLARSCDVEVINSLSRRGAQLHVLADRQRLRQVVINLLNNAVKYNHPHGTVTVSARRQGATVRIDVADNGIGIAAADLSRLFAPFERLSASSRGIEGTGLGLALSKALVEAMHGSLTVSSRAGEGSTFSITLPGAVAQEAAPAEIVPVLGSSASSSPLRVLYVEDTDSNVTLIRRMLSREPNLTLLSAASGEDAIATAATQRPDLILLDLHLPDMPGSDVFRRLRDQPSTSTIPVVVVSADATTHQQEALMLAGVDGYITKPFRVQQVSQVIREFRPAADPEARGDAHARIGTARR